MGPGGCFPVYQSYLISMAGRRYQYRGISYQHGTPSNYVKHEFEGTYGIKVFVSVAADDLCSVLYGKEYSTVICTWSKYA